MVFAKRMRLFGLVVGLLTWSIDGEGLIASLINFSIILILYDQHESAA